jgi:hypothetical protein
MEPADRRACRKSPAGWTTRHIEAPLASMRWRRPYHGLMAVLVHATLDEPERDLLGRFVAALEEVYGDDVDAVWLYGRVPAASVPMTSRDVDVFVVTRSDRDDQAFSPTLWRVLATWAIRRYLSIRDSALARGWRIGGRSICYSSGKSIAKRSCSTAVRDPAIGGAARAATRRSGERSHAGRCQPRGRRGLDGVLRDALRRARRPQRTRSARASHAGTWAPFREELVLTGEFDAELGQAAQRAQARREGSDYAAETSERSEGRQIVATAERFVAAIASLTP